MRSFRAGFVVVSMIFGTVAVAQETTVSTDEIQRLIRESEYHVTWQDQTVLPDLGAAWHATNRAQNLRFYFTGDEVRVVDRTADGSSELLRLGIRVPNREDQKTPRFEARNAELVVDRLEIVESFTNGRSGLGHSLTIDPLPASEESIELELELMAAGITVNDRSLEFVTGSGRRLVYSITAVCDVTGVEIGARFSAGGGRPRLLIDHSGAAGSITVKNLLTSTANTVLEGNVERRFFGSGVAVGDVNGDGFADVAVAVNGWDNGQEDEGAIMLFHGGPGGIASNGTGPIGPAANTVIETNQAHYFWPRDLSIVGDVNGDGYEDLVAGSGRWDPVQPPGLSTFWGAIWVFHGSATGIVASDLGDSSRFVACDRADAVFGWTVDAAGDVNGDGYADVIVGARDWSDDPLQAVEGAALIFHGSENGITGTTTDQADTILEGNEQFLWSGWSVSGLGDVNGDGNDDVAVLASGFSHPETNEGGIAIFHGSPDGVAGNPEQTLADAADALIEGNSTVSLGGSVQSGAGDVNGDGFSDLVVGVGDWEDSASHFKEGMALIFHGSESGIVSNGQNSFIDFADTVIEGNPNPHIPIFFGSSVGGIGDVNGDGFADVGLGAWGFTNPEATEGAVFVFHGGPEGVPDSRTDPVQDVADVAIEGNQDGLHLAVHPLDGGDVNGDGYSDLVVPAIEFTSSEFREGAVFIYHGAARALAQEAATQHDFSVAGALFGLSARDAGDLNGDGFSDFAVGAPFHDVVSSWEGSVHVFYGSANPSLSGPDWSYEGQYWQGQTGHGVASAGDLNGDGFGDLVVGTPNLNNPEIEEGRVDVFYGSAGGLSSSSDWFYEGNLDDASLGWAVSTAGDIDGDGYGDLIVGAPGYTDGQNSEGRAYVFFGSSMGLSSSPGWTHEINVASAQFGNAVASAGDVNGDGFGDVIIGASNFESGESYEGAAFAFHGSATGLPSVPNWIIETNRVDAHYGASVAGVGDVNGDGYADVIVGALTDSNGETREGRAYIYHGSAGGLSTTADRVLEEDIANASFGEAVAAAGDVNGDGWSDVMVGSPQLGMPASADGRAYLYLGTAAGVASDPVWIIEGAGVNDWLGSSVSGAGDVNGDGFPDVVIGVLGSDVGAADGGSVELYLGNAGAGRPVLARQYRGGDDPAPVQPWGLSYSGDAFEVSMTATSPRGRELVKMHVEACPPGEVWGDVDCRHQVSADWTAIPLGENGVVITEAVSGLTEDVLYHWRAHLLFVPLHADEPGITTPPVPRHGPWRRLFAQASAADIRVGMPQQITIELVDASSAADEGAPLAEVGLVLTTSDGEVSAVESSVDFDTFDVTAIAGEDYVHTSFNRFFSAGTASGSVQTIEVNLINDDLDEPEEDFVVEIFNPVGSVLGPQNTHTVTVADDDPPPELSALDVEVVEGTGFATVTLGLSALTSFEVTMDYATADGTAMAMLDYVPVSGTAMILPLDLTTTVEIPIEDDWLEEGTELFTLELSNPVNATLVTPVVTITIFDNDAGILFADGFELGTTSAWSKTVP